MFGVVFYQMWFKKEQEAILRRLISERQQGRQGFHVAESKSASKETDPISLS